MGSDKYDFILKGALTEHLMKGRGDKKGLKSSDVIQLRSYETAAEHVYEGK